MNEVELHGFISDVRPFYTSANVSSCRHKSPPGQT